MGIPPTSLVVKQEKQESVLVFVVTGEIDVYSASDFRRIVDEGSWGRQKQVIIHLSDVNFIDSTGLGVLVSILRRLSSQGGSLKLVITDKHLLHVFEVTALNQLFDINPTVEKAKSGFVVC